MAVLPRLILPALTLALGIALPAYAQTLTLNDLYYRIDPVGVVNPNHSNLVKVLKLTFTNSNPNITVTGMGRNPGAVPISLTGTTGYDESWTSGVTYTYYLYGTQQVYNSSTMMYESQPWTGVGLVIRPFDVIVTDNGTVDSRLDKRYSSVVYQDYKFNNSTTPVYTYRGGLYAGNNSDGSQVGRTFLKFPVVGGALSTVYQKGGLYLFATRLTKTGSVSVVAQRGSSSTWTQTDLVWTTAPSFTGTTTSSVSIPWNSTTPSTAWYKLTVWQLIADQLTASGSSNMTIGVRSSSEGGGGWAYFAKKEFSFDSKSGFGARLLYATNGQ